MRKPDLIHPTDEEEAAINQGIAADPDNPEISDDAFARMIPAAEAGPGLVPDPIRRRGPQRTPTKELISLRVDQDVLGPMARHGTGLAGTHQRDAAPGRRVGSGRSRIGIRQSGARPSIRVSTPGRTGHHTLLPCQELGRSCPTRSDQKPGGSIPYPKVKA